MISIIKKEKKLNVYFVFVILTDGSIHDMEETKRLIVEMSFMPVSIIILGIGAENFSKMFEFNNEILVDSKGN